MLIALLVRLAILCAAFFILCYNSTGSDDKNIRNFYTYPDRIQEIVRANPTLNKQIPARNSSRSFLTNLIAYSTVLFVFACSIREGTFLERFLIVLFLGEGLNIFDFLVIDKLWWTRTPRVRFTGTEDMDDVYADMSKHSASFARGAVMFLIAAVVDAYLLPLMGR